MTLKSKLKKKKQEMIQLNPRSHSRDPVGEVNTKLVHVNISHPGGHKAGLNITNNLSTLSKQSHPHNKATNASTLICGIIRKICTIFF